MQKNKKRNIIGIVLLVIAVLLIVMGIVMQIKGNNKTNDNDKDFIDGVAYSGEITGRLYSTFQRPQKHLYKKSQPH